MSQDKGSSKTDTLVKVVLVFFISLLSFSVGTFVGKQVSDADHRRISLEKEYKSEREIASTDEKAEVAADETPKGEKSDKISDKEVESLTEEFVNKEKSREPADATTAGESHEAAKETTEHTPEATAPHEGEHGASGYKTYKHEKVAASTHTASTDAPHKVAEKVAQGEAPSDGKHEERKPQSVLPSVASSAVGKYAVQVASYAEEKEAKNHAADLKAKGLTAFYLPATVNGHTWYRVLVGLFSNMKSADEFRAQLLKDTNTKSAIIQKIVQ